jgi:hypothetical protein
MAIAVVTFRWELHGPTQRRPARPSRQTGPVDSGTLNNVSDTNASVATTTTLTPFGTTTSSNA